MRLARENNSKKQSDVSADEGSKSKKMNLSRRRSYYHRAKLGRTRDTRFVPRPGPALPASRRLTTNHDDELEVASAEICRCAVFPCVSNVTIVRMA